MGAVQVDRSRLNALPAFLIKVRISPRREARD